VWAGRLSSFAAAVCLLIAVVTATVPDPAATGGVAKELTQNNVPFAADGGRPEASGTAVAGAAPASAFAPGPSGGAAGGAGGAAPAPPAPLADASASQRVAPQARSGASENSIPRDARTGPATTPARPSPGIWLALGGVLAFPGVVLLFLDRRARRPA
jgi:hypothetical protein